MGQIHLSQHHHGEGDGYGGKAGGNDGCFFCGVVTAFVLIAGEHNSQRAVTDPGGDAVYRRAARNLEQGTHELRQQGSHEFKKTEVQKQWKQEGGNQEDDDQSHDETEGHSALVRPGDGTDEFRKSSAIFISQIEVGQPAEDASQHAGGRPEWRAAEGFLQERIFHDESRLGESHQAQHGRNGQDKQTETGQDAFCDGRNPVRDDFDGDGPASVHLDWNHEQEDSDDGRHDKPRLANVFFHSYIFPLSFFVCTGYVL